MASDEPRQRASMLDPIERVSEIIFGVLMALSFTGSLSVATAGREELRTMLFAALGCNLAWGVTDAVMYLIGVVTERNRKNELLRRLQATQDKRAAHALIANELPERLAAAASRETLEALRQRLTAVTVTPARLGGQDYAAAFGVFVLVVLSTFPVVIPFLLVSETALALRLSNLAAVATLFVGGLVLGRYAGGKPWLYGLAMSAVGAVLVAIIIALGG